MKILTAVLLILGAPTNLKSQKAPNEPSVNDAWKEARKIATSYATDIIQWNMEMLTAPNIKRDSLQQLIEQRSQLFEQQMRTYERQLAKIDSPITHTPSQTATNNMTQKPNADSTNTLPLSVNISSDGKGKKYRKVVHFDWISSLELGKGTGMHNGSLSYNGPHSITFPRSTSTSAFDILTLSIVPTYHLKITLGVTARFETYHLEHNIQLLPNPHRLEYRISDTAFDVVKLKGTYWGSPLMIYLRPIRKNDFYVALGAEAGFLTKSSAYYSITQEEKKRRMDLSIRDRRDFALTSLLINARFRIGYEGFYGFAKYSLTPIYKTTGGIPDIRMLGFGIGLLIHDD